jgi:hypothetical protein
VPLPFKKGGRGPRKRGEKEKRGKGKKKDDIVTEFLEN